MPNKMMTLLALLVTTNIFAADYMFVIGGGGEPMTKEDGKPNDTTIFDGNLRSLSSYKKTRSDLNTKIIFNGGHSDTERIITQNFSPKEKVAAVFEKEPFLKQIADYEAKIKSGQIKAGDKILLYIDSHGAARAGKGELTHQISLGQSPLTNYEKLGGNIISLDTLKSLSDLAAKSGVKLGIIDFSCHSGNTLNLKNENTCVISSTGPKHYAFAKDQNTFGGQFTAKMQKGKSLEDVYLAARASYVDASFPMISSPVGLEVQQELYQLITPYLYYFDNQADKLRPHVLNSATTKDICLDRSNFRELEEVIQKVESLSNFLKNSNFTSKVASDLKANLKKYQKYIEDIKKDQIKAGSENLNQREYFCTDYEKTEKGKLIKKSECTNYTWEQLVSIDYNDILTFFNGQLADKKGDAQKEHQAVIQNIMKARARSLQLKKQYPDLKNLDKKFNNLADKEKKTFDLANTINRGLQKLYSDLYAIKQNETSEKNPCKDFVL